MSNSNNILSNYIKYDGLFLNDGNNKKEIVNSEQICINNCFHNPNCQGVNIDTNNNKPEVSADGYTYKIIPPVTCEYVSNICYSNTQTNDNNSSFYGKKNNQHLENNIPYLLKNNNICLSLKNNNSVIEGSACNDFINLSPIFFDVNTNIIKIGTEGDVCLNYNNSNKKLHLTKCNTFNPGQKFVYDNIYKTLRPYNDSTHCVNVTNSNNNTNYHYSVMPCTKPTSENNIIFDNYYIKTSEDGIEYFQNNDYSIDMTYYVIYISLLCIIAFLVIISSK